MERGNGVREAGARFPSNRRTAGFPASGCNHRGSANHLSLPRHVKWVAEPGALQSQEVREAVVDPERYGRCDLHSAVVLFLLSLFSPVHLQSMSEQRGDFQGSLRSATFSS